LIDEEEITSHRRGKKNNLNLSIKLLYIFSFIRIRMKVQVKKYQSKVDDQKATVPTVEFPTIVINNVEVTGPPSARMVPINRLDSLNLNSFILNDTRESFIKSSDPYDNLSDPVMIDNPDGNQVKISFTVPKLAALLTRNKLSPRSMKKAPLIVPDGSKYYQHLVLENDPEQLDEQYRRLNASAESVNDATNSMLPGARRVSFSTRQQSFSPRSDFHNNNNNNTNNNPLPVHSEQPPQRKERPQSVTTRPEPVYQEQPNVVYNYNPFTAPNKKVQGSPYIDPLTQERKVVNEETRQTLQENKSLKDLLVDALEDFYNRNEHMKSERDVETLQKVGLPPREVKQLYEIVSHQHQHQQLQLQQAHQQYQSRKGPPAGVQPNLVAVQVTANNNSNNNNGSQRNQQHRVNLLQPAEFPPSENSHPQQQQYSRPQSTSGRVRNR
jgi:hypothetical protein